MLRIKPFAALRPPTEKAAAVACVPYDVVSTSEARALAAGNPASFLHVIRPEIDLPDSTDPHAPAVYDAAQAAFARFQREGLLVRDDRPSIFIYRQEMDLAERRLSQTGIVACCHIDDYTSGLIKKHENTRKDKEDDRTRHVLTLDANAEPVFLLYKDRPELEGLVNAGARPAPLYNFKAPDCVHHTVWRAAASESYMKAFAQVPCAYVADGHHRTASAARAGAERRAANPRHTGQEEYNWFLAVLFPASALTILPYHRTVRDLDGRTPQEFLEELGGAAEVGEPGGPTSPPRPGTVAMYLGGRFGERGAWRLLTFPEKSIGRADPIRALDVSLLTARILGPVLGMGDLRTDKRIDFVGGIRGPAELEKRVDSGEAAVAFSMFPTTIDQLLAVADAGQIMPPKSTWFEPKLRSGLLVHTLD